MLTWPLGANSDPELETNPQPTASGNEFSQNPEKYWKDSFPGLGCGESPSQYLNFSLMRP